MRTPCNGYDMVQLKLYIAGVSKKMTDYSQSLVDYFESRSIDASMTVINVLEDPAKAMQDDVIATPTLIREFPEPRKRMIGDISNLKMVSRALCLEA
jgi:circadian clock protein KaiB